ncbi:MAG: hypothetical protein D4R94_03680, partial [Chitinophagaceae bacterium]
MVLFIGISSITNAQTIGGMRPSDDFDGDGIINSIDLDDDNDGIPDTDEYCKSSILLPATNTTSAITEFRVPTGWTITNSSPDIATTASSIYSGWVGGCSGTAPAAPNGHTSWVNFYSNTQEAFKTNIAGLTVGKTYILKVFYAKFAATPALGRITVKLGTTVIDQYTPTLGCGWETRFITFTAAATSQDLQFQNTGIVSPMQNASVSVSADPLYEVCDTDNDGIPNQFDLDSDGDGCPDAKEAGVTGTLRNGDVKNGANGGVVTTTTNMAGAIAGVVSSYGANGLADAVETSAETGIINYPSTYASYALSANLNICSGVDSDGDGVTDLTDLDDDNDGVKDCEEGIIIPLDFSAPTLFTNRNIDATGIVKYTSSQFGTGGQLNGPSGDANGNISVSVNTGVGLRTSYSVAFSYPTSIIIRNNTKIVQGYLTFDEYFDFSTSVGNVIALSDPAFELQIFLNNAWLDVPANYSAATIRWRVKEGSFQPGSGNFAFTIQNASSFTFYHYNNQNTSANATTLNISRNCIDTDTDNDGIPNRLDLDSDGDSCPDALESGVSGSLTIGTIKNGSNGNITAITNNVANAVAVGTYGTNGLADGVESTPESGFVNYTSKYAQFALSPTLANCKDSDGDGIVDLLDIDDDNDGVLDATESPSCFMSVSDWNTSEKSMYVNITSDLTTLAGYTNFGELTDNEGALSGTKFVTATAQGQLNKAIFKVEFSSPTQLDALYIQKYDATQIFAATAASLKLQGSNDNNSWTDLTSALGQPANASFTTANGARAITNANKFIVTTGAGKYKYYRIYGILAANVLSGTANEFFFDINNATYQASNFTLANCASDIDGDGIVNHLDLDSDGDGCSDALESGATTSTTTNFTFSGTMGANGLDNSLETVADNGNINYTSTYTTYAKEILINACLDTDGDGVRNVLDIDDDNDGVLDVTEQYCATNGVLTDLYGPTYWKSISWTGGAYLAQYSTTTPDIYIDGVLNNGVEVFRPGTESNPIAGDDFTATPIIFSLVPTNPIHADGFSIVNDYGASGDNIVKADIKLYTGSVSSPTLMGTETIDNMLDVSSTTRYAFSKGYDNITSIKILVYKTEPAGTQAANGMQMGELGLYSNAGTYCSDIDTDGDGTPNRLDLDSDGDGCSDAIESGATTNTTSNFSFIGTMGTNGLANSLETVADNGIINYLSTYTYSVANNYAACSDTDGDGINDITDIDDDNDGVLDAVESPSCFFKEFEWNTDDKSSFVKVTSDLISTNTFLSQLLTDNNTSSSITFTTASAQSQIGKAIFTANFNTPVKLDAWYILKTNATQIFATTASSLMVQGSNNNTSWTNLSAAIASPANATNTTVNGSIILANSNKFTITTNAGYYKYYRIYGVGTSAANILGGSAADFYFDFNANSYNPSQYPKLTCVNDTDGDGIPNHLDLDSDGDGCSDALEAGTTTNTTANYKFTGSSSDFGANGFYNALEKTAAESNIYKAVYTYDFATDNTINACTDTDGDGVPDVYDLDDDNDGILDFAESPTCFYDLLDLAIPATVSSDLTTYSTYALSRTIDADKASISGFTSGQNWANKEIFKFSAKGYIPITSITFDIAGSWNLSSANTSTFLLQGSGDNVSWTDLSVPTYSIATTGQFVISNTLAPTFKFKYYRIYGINGNCGYSGISNVTFNLSNTANPSAYKKTLCVGGDTDGDGTPNYLDLDSDNDGCSDALEAGTTSSTTANFKFTGTTTDFGANGFYNNLETSTESGTYSGAYTYYFAQTNSIKVCTDTDGDGVLDIYDIDSDNDGILNAEESPECFYSSYEISKPIAVSSDLTQYLTFTIGNVIDRDLTTKSGFTSGQDWVNKEIFKFTTAGYMPINSLTLDMVDSWPMSASTSNTFKLQGSGDGAYWTDLSLPIGSTLGAGKLVITNSLAPNVRFKYLRIIGVAGVSGYVGVANAFFSFTTTPNPNAYLKPTCTSDTDSDGTPNYLDLDSDGDGCSDALEAGTTTLLTSNYKFTGASTSFGANGFYNSLETATESGIYTGTYTYYFASNNSINACQDTDADGVRDVFDLDDDNDGVLDNKECACVSTIASTDLTTPTKIYTTPTNKVGFNGMIGAMDGSGLSATPTTIASLSTITHASPTTLLNAIYLADGSGVGDPWTFEWANPTDIKGLALWLPGSTSYGGGDAPMKKVRISWTNCIGVTNSKIFELGEPSVNAKILNFDEPILSATSLKMDILEVWYDPFMDLGTSHPWSIMDASMPGSAYNVTLGEVRIINQTKSASMNCTLDTDGDGVPNTRDLDSDGDGCPDAVEAGTTAVSTSGVASSAKLTTSVIPAPYGANGFANGLETASESGAYSGTYTYSSVIDATVNGCTDTDGDGVTDVLDLDDDNDGILDTIEDNCSVIVVNKTGAIITKPSTINYTFNGNTIANLIDGVDNNVYVINGPSGTLNGPWLNFEFPTPKALTYLEIGHYSGQYLFSTTSTYKIQGSTDNTTWTDVTGTLTYNNIATSTSGGLSNNNSNIANFPTNTKAYKYYRILGINASAGAGWATEIHFKEFLCATADLDGDGIPNRLDLDSDGDGCPDAVEARTTAISTSGVSSAAKLTTSVIPAPYGANGFANGLETATESGLYTGTYTYNYAIDATINACTDSDGDGVPDVIDLDDDNDGVLDSGEQINCSTSGIDLNSLTYNGSAITAKTANSFTTAGGDTWKSSYSNENLKLPISLKFKHNSTTGYEMFGLLPAATAQTPTTYTDGGYKFYPQTTNVYGYFTTTWDFNQAVLTTDVLSIDISSTGYVTAAINGVTKKAFQGLVSDYKLDLSSYRASSISDIILTEATHPAQFSCTDLDTDNDGIPNRLDLDSDGDGCPDAKEAGVNGTLSSGSVKNGSGGAVTSTITIANAIASGPYGANGLADGVETSTESGVVTYTSTYTLNALVKDLVAPTITTQPLNKTVFVAGTAVLTVTAGAPPANRTLTYQWYKAGVAISGATSATYTITTSATTANADDYYCTLGFVNSCLTTNTNTINVTVLTNPVGLTACQDGSAILSVTKTGTNAVTYQWKKATTNLVNGSNIAGVTTSSLTLTNLALADAGAYTLVATDANGAVISSLAGTITITNNTKYTIPDYTTCVTASNYTLTAASVATTSGAITTTWERSTDGGNTWLAVTSASDGVTYTVTTTTTGGTSTSTLRLSSV